MKKQNKTFDERTIGESLTVANRRSQRTRSSILSNLQPVYSVDKVKDINGCVVSVQKIVDFETRIDIRQQLYQEAREKEQKRQIKRLNKSDGNLLESLNKIKSKERTTRNSYCIPAEIRLISKEEIDREDRTKPNSSITFTKLPRQSSTSNLESNTSEPQRQSTTTSEANLDVTPVKSLTIDRRDSFKNDLNTEMDKSHEERTIESSQGSGGGGALEQVKPKRKRQRRTKKTDTPKRQSTRLAINKSLRCYRETSNGDETPTKRQKTATETASSNSPKTDTHHVDDEEADTGRFDFGINWSPIVKTKRGTPLKVFKYSGKHRYRNFTTDDDSKPVVEATGVQTVLEQGPKTRGSKSREPDTPTKTTQANVSKKRRPRKKKEPTAVAEESKKRGPKKKQPVEDEDDVAVRVAVEPKKGEPQVQTQIVKKRGRAFGIKPEKRTAVAVEVEPEEHRVVAAAAQPTEERKKPGRPKRLEPVEPIGDEVSQQDTKEQLTVERKKSARLVRRLSIEPIEDKNGPKESKRPVRPQSPVPSETTEKRGPNKKAFTVAVELPTAVRLSRKSKRNYSYQETRSVTSDDDESTVHSPASRVGKTKPKNVSDASSVFLNGAHDTSSKATTDSLVRRSPRVRLVPNLQPIYEADTITDFTGKSVHVRKVVGFRASPMVNMRNEMLSRAFECRTRRETAASADRAKSRSPKLKVPGYAEPQNDSRLLLSGSTEELLGCIQQPSEDDEFAPVFRNNELTHEQIIRFRSVTIKRDFTELSAGVQATVVDSSEGILRIDPLQKTTLNEHDADIRYYVQSGCIELHLNKKSIVMSIGDLFKIPKCNSYEIKNLSKTDNAYIIFKFDSAIGANI